MNYTILFLLLLFSTQIFAEDGESYVEVPSDDITKLTDVNREAEAWAMCAASYNTMAMLLKESKPAQSDYISDLANGAELAIMISVVADAILEDDDISPERFNAVWTASKVLMQELPKTKQKFIFVMIEQDNEKMLVDLTATISVCVSNLENQQMYIDLWRELSKSTLLAPSVQE
jgi:hypothetical protein